MTVAPVLSVSGLASITNSRRRTFPQTPERHAVSDVSFDLAPGETLGLVASPAPQDDRRPRGAPPHSQLRQGRIVFGGEDITHLGGEPLRRLRARMQIVLQDPYTSLNPRMKGLEHRRRTLIVHGLAGSAEEARAAVSGIAGARGAPSDPRTAIRTAFPADSASGSRIARALALKPALIVG